MMRLRLLNIITCLLSISSCNHNSEHIESNLEKGIVFFSNQMKIDSAQFKFTHFNNTDIYVYNREQIRDSIFISDSGCIYSSNNEQLDSMFLIKTISVYNQFQDKYYTISVYLTQETSRDGQGILYINKELGLLVSQSYTLPNSFETIYQFKNNDVLSLNAKMLTDNCLINLERVHRKN